MNSVLAPVDQLVAVVYVSSAHKQLSEAELTEILQIARQNNERLEITGMLLYRDGNFLQVLEGPASAVDDLIAKIRKDSRHDGVMLLSRKKIDEREFADWHMAFRNMSKNASGERYDSLLESSAEDEDEGREESQLVYRLLRRLKEDMP